MRHPLALVGLLLLFGLSAPRISAQSADVRGFVVEEDGEQPLQGATITLLRGNTLVAGAASDADGFFHVTAVPVGSYTFRVSFVGFRPFEETVVLNAGESVFRRIELVLDQETLDEIVVEAQNESGITAGVAGVERIRPADIARVPVPGASPDLAAYVQSVPGVVIPGDRGGQYFIRGGAEDQNLVLIDGIPVYGPFHILNFFSAFPESIIDEATLHTGGFDAEFGERLSSVLEVSSRNGNKQAIAAGGSVAPFLSSAQVEIPLVPRRASILASARKSLVEQVSPRMFGEDLRYDFGDLFAKFHTFLGRRHSFSAFALLTEDSGDIRGTVRNYLGEEVRDVDPLLLEWSNEVYGGAYERVPGRIPLGIKLTAGRSAFTNSFGPEAAPDRIASIASNDARLDMRWLAPRLTLRSGGLYRMLESSRELSNQFRDLPDTAQDEHSVWAAYSALDLRIAQGALVLTPGIHLTGLESRPPSVDARFRVQYAPRRLAGEHEITASVGTYHQTIAGINDRRDVGNVFTAWAAIPEGAPLPMSTHAVVGWSGPIVTGLRAAVELYAKRFTDLQVPEFSVLPSESVGLQSATGEAMGADVRLSTTPRPFFYESLLSGWVSYSLGKVEYETETGLTYYPTHDRRHSVNAVLRAERGEMSLNVQAQMSSGLAFTPSSGLDVWQLLTPSSDVGSEPGVTRVLYGEPGSRRQPMYARTDIYLERRVEEGRFTSTARLGVMNVFDRDNLFYYDLFTFRRVNQLPVIPTVAYRLEFR